MWNPFRSKPVLDETENDSDNFITAEDARILTIKNESDYNNEYVIKKYWQEYITPEINAAIENREYYIEHIFEEDFNIDKLIEFALSLKYLAFIDQDHGYDEPTLIISWE